MDWNKTKTIFIVVFSILNVFLYSLYINRSLETQNMQVMEKISIEESLKMDNITVAEMPHVTKDSYYMSAQVLTFSSEDMKGLNNQSANVLNGTEIHSTLKDTIVVRNEKGDYNFSDLLSKYVMHGNEYTLWSVDEEEQQAVFFQQVDDTPIYFSQKAILKVNWNDDGEVTDYDQHVLGEFNRFNHKKDLMAPIEALGSLYSKGLLKQDSTVKSMKLGYSTLVQFTEKQVFAPTWHVHVELKSGEFEDHFINAIEGKIIEFQTQPTVEENE